MIIGDFHIPVPIIDRVSRDKIREDIGDLHNTVNLLNLIDIYRTLHSTVTEYAKIDHIWTIKQISEKFHGCVLVSPFPEHLSQANGTSVLLKTYLINMRASLVAQW